MFREHSLMHTSRPCPLANLGCAFNDSVKHMANKAHHYDILQNALLALFTGNSEKEPEEYTSRLLLSLVALVEQIIQVSSLLSLSSLSPSRQTPDSNPLGSCLPAHAPLITALESQAIRHASPDLAHSLMMWAYRIKPSSEVYLLLSIWMYFGVGCAPDPKSALQRLLTCSSWKHVNTVLEAHFRYSSSEESSQTNDSEDCETEAEQDAFEEIRSRATHPLLTEHGTRIFVYEPLLGLCYQNGIGCDVNQRLASRYLNKGVTEADPLSCTLKAVRDN